MSNEEYKNIHEFDFNLICVYFSSIERQEPGSEDSKPLVLLINSTKMQPV